MPEKEHFLAKVACLPHIAIIDNIEKKLNKQQVEMFTNSFSGHFVMVLNFQLKLYTTCYYVNVLKMRMIKCGF